MKYRGALRCVATRCDTLIRSVATRCVLARLCVVAWCGLRWRAAWRCGLGCVWCVVLCCGMLRCCVLWLRRGVACRTPLHNVALFGGVLPRGVARRIVLGSTNTNRRTSAVAAQPRSRRDRRDKATSSRVSRDEHTIVAVNDCGNICGRTSWSFSDTPRVPTRARRRR